jgi:two-component system OmpR family sensor kinase
LVIDLTASEKSTFFRFLGLYLGSSLVLMLLIAFFYYQNEKRLYFDLTKSNMQNIVSDISSKIVFAHMTDSQFDTSNILKTEKYKLSFYNEKKEKVFGNLDDKIDFTKSIIRHEDHFILVDHSPLGHLGIYHIAIEENLFFKQINQLQFNITVFFVTIYSIIALIGFYLAKLFLQPIKEERKKLNNFIKDTTHELNTPISAILMSTESSNLNEKQLERIRLSAKRVSEIYKDLTYIFLQQHEQKQDINTISIDSIIMEQLNYFEPLASKKKIVISANLESFSYAINQDDFIRLFNNLVSNAIKYNKVGGEIHITLTQQGDLTVADTGIGIDNAKLKDIFKRYFRATSEQGGFGIGLNIVRHICQRYKILIDVQSTFKKGTTFTLKF